MSLRGAGRKPRHDAQGHAGSGGLRYLLLARYAVSGTEIGTGLRVRYAMSGTEIGTGLRVRYAMSGTEAEGPRQGTVYCEDDEKLEEARQLFEDCLQRMAATKHQEERICRNWLRDCQIRLRMLAPKADVKTEEEEGEESVGEGGRGGGEEERAGEGESE